MQKALLKWTFLIADVIFVGLFLAGIAARYVHPRYAWWLQVVALGLPLWTLAVVVITAGAAAMGRWYVVAAHVPFLMLAALRFFPAAWLNSQAQPGEDRLTLASANVKAKFPAGGSIIESLPPGRVPDVFAVQEAAVKTVADEFGAHRHVLPLLLEYGFCPPARISETRDRIHNPIFSSLPCITLAEVNSVAFSDDQRPLMVTRGVFAWRGREFALYNVHLRSFSIPEDERADPIGWFTIDGRIALLRRDILIRAREAEAVRRMLEAESLPFILCGDFNSTPHQWTYGHLAARLTDAFDVAGSGWRPTFHSKLPLISIDHVLVSGDWDVLSARTGKASVSDHLPLVVELAWSQSVAPKKDM